MLTSVAKVIAEDTRDMNIILPYITETEPFQK